MDKWFHKQSKLVQVILLIIPVVGYICELGVRWCAVIRKPGGLNIAVALIITFTAWIPIIHWIDAVWVALNNKFILEK